MKYEVPSWDDAFLRILYAFMWPPVPLTSEEEEDVGNGDVVGAGGHGEMSYYFLLFVNPTHHTLSHIPKKKNPQFRSFYYNYSLYSFSFQFISGFSHLTFPRQSRST